MAIFIYSPALTQVMSRRVRKFNLHLGHAPQVFDALGALPHPFQHCQDLQTLQHTHTLIQKGKTTFHDTAYLMS